MVIRAIGVNPSHEQVAQVTEVVRPGLVFMLSPPHGGVLSVPPGIYV